MRNLQTPTSVKHSCLVNVKDNRATLTNQYRSLKFNFVLKKYCDLSSSIGFVKRCICNEQNYFTFRKN